jgi:uncharacterized membrane protein (DUF4010 family)
VNDSVVLRLAVAALAGLAVGLEREWSGHATGPSARFAGLRTFFLLGILGGVAGWLASAAGAGLIAMSVTLLAAGSALVVSAYILAARSGGERIEATTEVSALVVLALGTLAGLGLIVVTSGATAVVVLALSEKERLRSAVARIGAAELRAAFQFAVLALVILPLLPDRTYGPLGGINPRQLWIVVLIFSGLNFAGYLARKAVGAARGYGVTGILGGIVSSTGVTLQFSRLSRDEPALGRGLAIGVIGACTVLIPRVLVLSTVLNHRVARALLPLLAPAFAVGAAITIFALWRQDKQPTGEADVPSQSPLRLASAIRMALAFQAALMAIEVVRGAAGSPGVLVSAALLGLTDMDALTLSMNRLGTAPDVVALAARAIAIGIVANSLLKLSLSAFIGSGQFRRMATSGLALLSVAVLVTLVVLW